MKKRVLCIIMAVLIIAASALLVKLVIVMIFDNTHSWKLSADYEKYEDDFNVVKNYVATTYSGKWGKVLSVSNHNGEITLYDQDVGEYLDLPDDVASSLDTIRNNGFPDKDSVLTTIRIYEERIYFCISNLRYALVYSPDEKPTWVNSPDENADIKTKKIEDGWYHIKRD